MMLSSYIDIVCAYIVDRYKATVYPCPEKLEERREMLANLGTRMADLQIVSIVKFLMNRWHVVVIANEQLY